LHKISKRTGSPIEFEEIAMSQRRAVLEEGIELLSGGHCHDIPFGW